MDTNMDFRQISLNASMLYLGEQISEAILNKVQHAFHILQGMEGITDITPSYTSLLIEYDTGFLSHDKLLTIIKKKLQNTPYQNTNNQKHIQIPTDYTKGVDLEAVAKHHDLSPQEVIRLHSRTIYRVYAIGFMVGFAYLGILPKNIATPRLSTPRAKVPKGAVAIADNQTAIYPQQSAGGWNIIGHTDFDDFDTFSIGDSVEFVSI